MTCDWQELLRILPPWLGRELNQEERENLQELRIRRGQPVRLLCGKRSRWTSRAAEPEDLSFCINTASRYSPWASQTMASGFLTASGGHRIGICGTSVVNRGESSGFREVSSLCIRVARAFPGVAEPLKRLNGSILLLGPPGSGKTTLLRDLVLQIAAREMVCVVDERWELFPDTNQLCVDVLHGCSKAAGISMLIRTMGPDCVAMDEITEEADCRALLESHGCGVRLLATAHGASLEDLMSRRVYKPLIDHHLFDHVVIMGRDKTWRLERMGLRC